MQDGDTVLKSLPVDIFLGAHGAYFNMKTKYARMQQGAADPFIDPDGYREYVARVERSFQAKLAQQQSAQSAARPAAALLRRRPGAAIMISGYSRWVSARHRP